MLEFQSQDSTALRSEGMQGRHRSISAGDAYTTVLQAKVQITGICARNWTEMKPRPVQRQVHKAPLTDVPRDHRRITSGADCQCIIIMAIFHAARLSSEVCPFSVVIFSLNAQVERSQSVDGLGNGCLGSLLDVEWDDTPADGDIPFSKKVSHRAASLLSSHGRERSRGSNEAQACTAEQKRKHPNKTPDCVWMF